MSGGEGIEVSDNVEHPIVVWNESRGEVGEGVITELSSWKYGLAFRLGEPYQGIWFSLNDLMRDGYVSISGFRVSLAVQWAKDEAKVREAHSKLKGFSWTPKPVPKPRAKPL